MWRFTLFFFPTMHDSRPERERERGNHLHAVRASSISSPAAGFMICWNADFTLAASLPSYDCLHSTPSILSALLREALMGH